MKAYIWVCRNDVSHYTVIDLEHLPSGATSHFLEEFRVQGTVITEWLRMDLDRAVAAVERINARDYDEDALRLVSHLASFAENAPPADEPRDLLLAVTATRASLDRVKSAVAQELRGDCGLPYQRARVHPGGDSLPTSASTRPVAQMTQVPAPSGRR